MSEPIEVLTSKAKILHDVIEQHPSYSMMVTKQLHEFLDEVISNGYLLKDVPKQVLRSNPTDEEILKYL